MAQDALSINADVFQFFTRNPRGGKAKNISSDDVMEFKKIAQQNNFGKILAHAPFTMNAVKNIINGVQSKDNVWSVNTDKEYHETKSN